MRDKDKYDEYNESVAVPFLPRQWLDGFTLVSGFLILGFLCLKYWVGWGLLSDTPVLSDISILTTVIFSGTFMIGRARHWRTHKDEKRGGNKVLDNLEKVSDAVAADTSLTDHEKFNQLCEEIRQLKRGRVS